MKTFTSISDLDRLSDDGPAKPIVRQLLEWLIADGEFPNHPYDPEEHGYNTPLLSLEIHRSVCICATAEDVARPQKS